MARRPIIEGAVDHLVRNRPLAAALVEGHRNASDNPTTTTQHDSERDTVEAQSDAIARSPEAANAANLEPPRDSRVVSGSTAATVAALSTFFAGIAGILGGLGPALSLSGPSRWVAIAMVILGGTGSSGGAFALYGRLRDNLPPMHRTFWNPLSWFARSKLEVMTDPTGQEND